MDEYQGLCAKVTVVHWQTQESKNNQLMLLLLLKILHTNKPGIMQMSGDHRVVAATADSGTEIRIHPLTVIGEELVTGFTIWINLKPLRPSDDSPAVCCVYT